MLIKRLYFHFLHFHASKLLKRLPTYFKSIIFKWKNIGLIIDYSLRRLSRRFHYRKYEEISRGRITFNDTKLWKLFDYTNNELTLHLFNYYKASFDPKQIRARKLEGWWIKTEKEKKSTVTSLRDTLMYSTT